jgi:hypothetical protein
MDEMRPQLLIIAVSIVGEDIYPSNGVITDHSESFEGAVPRPPL